MEHSRFSPRPARTIVQPKRSTASTTAISSTTSTTQVALRTAEPVSLLASSAVHLPALDGLRGIAILMTMVLHFGSSEVHDGLAQSGVAGRLWATLANQGGAGVDLFFVLSGFLVTRILLDTRGRPGFLRNFYMRRVVRIFPLYYLTLLLVFALYLPLLAPRDPQTQQLAGDQLWLWTYLPNVPAAFAGTRWRGAGLELHHFWSLAVEEHFYLAWPLLVLWLPRRTLLLACAALCAMAVGTKLLLLRGGLEDAVYQLTISRCDGLALGAAAAILAWRTGPRAPLVRAARPLLLGAGGLIVVWAALSDRHPWLWWTPALTHTIYGLFFLGVLALVLTAAPGGLLGRCLRHPLLLAFGRLSYGLYVFHVLLRPALQALLPMSSLQKLVGSPLAAVLCFLIISTAACYGLAWVSFHQFEKRFLSLKRHFSDKASVTTSIATPSLPSSVPA